MKIRDGIGCFLAFLGVGASFGAVPLTSITLQRFMFTYNDEGRYFDAVSSVVYHDGARFVYAGLALLGWLVVGASLALSAWLWLSGRREDRCK